MLSFLFATAVWGLFAAGVIIITKLVVMSVKYLVNYAKEKLKANNQNKVMVTQTKDLFKEKMKTADRKKLSELEDLAEECPIITGVYNAETDDIEDIRAIKTNNVEGKLKTALNNTEDGMLIIEN
ncbi:hypothetical protein AXF41_03210 [Clostridium haemolyticum]|uniref:hypothetical protein n=1 Tax=Clostridium haemolyticum TaxID=84025 RepID=UPI0009C64AC0|nr:hypothetical protein [Clostridium haemolyticum]OOB76354.1 hypothetical protein AXF41_03210 [Clostridium haemolyticum]